MLSFLVLSASLLMPRGRDVRPTDSSTPARSPASRMSNLPNGPASPSSTRTWLQKYMMHQLEEATCDGNVLMVDALLTADLLLFGVMKRQQYPDFNECYDVPRRGGYDLTSCIVDATDEGEVTPLVLAIRHENMDVINVFIEAGASLKGGRDENELTPLMYAIDTRNVNVIDALTAAGVSLEAECEDDLTPLEYAIDGGSWKPWRWIGDVRVDKALVEAGASLGAVDGDEFTPLKYAISQRWRFQSDLQARLKVVAINVLKDAERARSMARSDTACLQAIFSEEYAMPGVELDFEPSHEDHVDLPWPPKAWISSASGEWRQVKVEASESGGK